MHPAARPLSYPALFDPVDDGGAEVHAVVIPQIQRDYAQGRRDAGATRVRQDFLDAICGAATGSSGPVTLDFVYGSVRDGVLAPLDGQQRLTALFLLHWVAAIRAGELQPDAPWSRFAYATRDSARMFTERIVRHGAALPTAEAVGLRQWIEDQPWHLHAWRHDATVQSMLVVLDEIEKRLAEMPAGQVWERLQRRDSPAISFRLLQIGGSGGSVDELGDLQGDELYIKMNSRGKPLTEFENLKAILQRMLASVGLADEFATKVDGAWSDLLWAYRGDDQLIDEEFVRLLEFVHDICRWRDAGPAAPSAEDEPTRAGRLDLKLRRVLIDSPDAERHREYFFHVFDTWAEEDPASYFGLHFSVAEGDDRRTRLFTMDGDEDLFHAACRRYQGWQTRGRGDRALSIADTLMLHAVLVHRAEETDEFSSRARALRNLLGQRENRSGEFPQLLAEVEEFVRTGDLTDATMLGWDYGREEERSKAEFVDRHPHLEPALVLLENHPLLRGSLTAFELDPEVFSERAAAFDRVVDPRDIEDFHGALLAAGFTTAGRWRRGTRRLAGTSVPGQAGVWRELLQRSSRDEAANLRSALATVLDAVSTCDASEVRARLRSLISAAWDRATEDGRLRLHHYLARHPEMRQGESGQFELEEGSEYQVCALRRTQLNSNYRDAYLAAALAADSASSAAVVGTWFTGYASNPRWLEIPGRGRVRVRDAGIEVQLDPDVQLPPEAGAWLQQPLSRRAENPAPEAGALGVPVPFDVLPDGRVVDSVDRVAVLTQVISRLAESDGHCLT